MTEREGPRALLTNREIDVIVEDESVDDSVRRTLLSRIETKIGVLGQDVELLRQHRPDLAKELIDTVSKPSEQERMERAEHDIRSLAFKLNRVERELGIEPETRVSDLAIQSGVQLPLPDDPENDDDVADDENDAEQPQTDTENDGTDADTPPEDKTTDENETE